MTDTLNQQTPFDLSGTWHQVVAGADWETTIYLLDDNEDPEDTTGWTMFVYIATTDGTILDTLSIGSGITHTPALGKFDVSYSNTLTDLITAQQVRVEVKTVDAGGGVDYLFYATLPVFHPVS